MTDSVKIFSDSVHNIGLNIDDCLFKAFKKKDIKITKHAFSILRSALFKCNAAIYLFKRNKENEELLNLYKKHEAWKKQALDDPLTSDYVKDVIRSKTNIKKIYDWNGFTKELAESLSNAFIHLTSKEILKKEEAYLFLSDLLFECFPNSPEIENLQELTLKKAIQRILKKI